MPPEPLSDVDWLKRHHDGDPNALEALFHRHRDAAYRVAYRLLGREEDALDAVQNGFIKVLGHLSDFEHRSSFRTWLLRVVSNAALDLGRSRRRRERLMTNGTEAARNGAHNGSRNGACEPDSLEAAENDPALLAELSDTKRAVQEALSELPEPQRLTFVLHVEAGLTYREIADTMEVSIGTVMSRLFYARQRLKGLLAPRLPS